MVKHVCIYTDNNTSRHTHLEEQCSSGLMQQLCFHPKIITFCEQLYLEQVGFLELERLKHEPNM